jgi:cytochrome c oxidase assembly protein subunit 15
MNGAIIPKTAFDKQPIWRNYFENKALVQFNHRTMAYLTEMVSCYLMYIIMKNKVHTPASFAGVVAFVLINYQALSGIITLLSLVPPEKASLHQTTAIVTLSSVMLMVYLARAPKIRVG